MRVRKPFDNFFDFEEQKQQEKQKKENPEQEEKPVVENKTNTSEDVHGGNETTYSIENSEQRNSAGSESIEEESSNETENHDDSENEDSENSETENSKNCKAETESNETETENSKTEYHETEDSENSESENNESECSENENSESCENEEISESSESSESDSETEEETENESSEGEQENSSESEDSNNDSVGQYNTEQVVDVTETALAVKYYQTEFYRFIEMIADEKTKIYDSRAAEEYNVKKLMFRRYERKSLNSYKMQKVRESVVLVLDNSGSMSWWSNELRTLAKIAIERNDMEIYIAPNGFFETKILKNGNKTVDNDTVMKQLRNRRIIYVGDFDGADTAIKLSWFNDVVWVCPEDRYRRFRSHNWVHYDESDFRGAFLRVYSLKEMFAAFRRLLSTQNLRVWIDLYENDEFENDGWYS